MAALLAAVFFLHTFVIPFAGSDLVLCVGDDGHLAFELASRAYHHSAPESVTFRLKALPHTYNMICKDLGLATLNNHLTTEIAKKQPVAVYLPTLSRWSSPAEIFLSSGPEEQSAAIFPAFLRTTILLI